MLAECVICQPFAFWSSLAYLLSGIILHTQIKNHTPESRYWFRAIVVVTLSSFFAHASFTNLALAIDMAAIILLTGFIHFPKDRLVFFVGIFAAISLGLFYLPLDWWVPLTTIFFFLSAIHLWRKTPVPLHRETLFVTSMVLYGVSFSFFLFDKEPWLCGLNYFPYGHTLWHIGSGLTAYLFGRWYFLELPKKL